MANEKKPPDINLKTKSGFNFRHPVPPPIRQFDDSDFSSSVDPVSDMGTEYVESTNAPAKRPASLLPRSVPSHLLMISILEQLCMFYGNDKINGKELFQMINEHLIKMKVVSPLTVLDEMSSVRSQYRLFMHNVLQAAMVKISSQRALRALPASGVSDRPVQLMSQYSLVTNDEVFHMQTSRYKTEFNEIKRIGKGGFGSVYKAKHKLDGRVYAIKKIKFKHSKPEIWMKILREVKALANLQHPNIVGYNAAWLEYQTRHTEDQGSGDPKNVHPSSFQNTESDDGILFTNSQGDSLHDGIFDMSLEKQDPTENLTDFSFSQESVFVDTESHTHCAACFELRENKLKQTATQFHKQVISSIEHTCKKGRSFTNDSVSLSTQETFSKTSELWNNGIDRNAVWNNRLGVKRSISCEPAICGEKFLGDSKDDDEYSEELVNSQLFVCLFIQMELCSLTLTDWMKNRNERCTDADFDRYEGQNMKIYKQILKGVDFIHSNGLIHRDIKPKNIFLHEPELHVKIGDFGLAKDDLMTSSTEDALLTPTPDVEFDAEKKYWDDHTSGVGTSTYAAPEQLQGTLYNNKCDVYSLGVLLYQMFHKFDTEMEKFKHLTDLRNGIMDQQYLDRWPEQSVIVSKMIHEHPHKRPTTKELLQSELFLTKDQIIREMRKKMEEKDLEIKHLRELLRKRERDLQKICQDASRPLPRLEL